MMKVKTSLFITTLFLSGLLFLPLTANVALGEAIPMLSPGCCTTQEDSGQCVECPVGETCLASQDFCESENGFFGKGACFDDGGGATCGDFVVEDGCCVVEPGSCIDDIDPDVCFFEASPSPELFISNTSCSEVPQCTPTRNIPTMSNWGLIALAAVFVLVGIWGITRKKAQA